MSENRSIGFAEVLKGATIKAFLKAHKVKSDALESPRDFINELKLAMFQLDRGQLCFDLDDQSKFTLRDDKTTKMTRNCFEQIRALAPMSNPSGPFSLFLIPGGDGQKFQDSINHVNKIDPDGDYAKHIVLAGSDRRLSTSEGTTEADLISNLVDQRLAHSGKVTGTIRTHDIIDPQDIAYEAVKQLLNSGRIYESSEICIIVPKIIGLKMSLAWPARARMLNYFGAVIASAQDDQEVISSMSPNQKFAIISNTLIAAAEAKINHDTSQQKTFSMSPI